MTRPRERSNEAPPKSSRLNSTRRRLPYSEIMSSKSRDRRPRWRSRSPPHQKSMKSPPRRQKKLEGGKGSLDKRNRSKSPPAGTSRSYSTVKDPDNRSSSIVASCDEVERFRSDKYAVDKPLYRGPEKSMVLKDRESLKKITINMDNVPEAKDKIKRNIVNLESITVIRRAGEGSRPIFERDEIINYRRKFEDDQRERKRNLVSSPIRAGRRHSPSDFRSRDTYLDNGGPSRSRDYSNSRSPREYDSRAFDHRREDRDGLRHPSSSSNRARSRSRDRMSDFSSERKERYEGLEDRQRIRRSMERLRPEERSLRRHASPGHSRRRFEDCRLPGGRRGRSLERRDLDPPHLRDLEPSPTDRFSSDYLPQSGPVHYNSDVREAIIASPPRGRGRAVAFRDRGIPLRPFPGASGMIVHPAPPFGPIRAAIVPPARAMGRRLPVPIRLVAPVPGHIIRVMAPGVPARPPVFPVTFKY